MIIVDWVKQKYFNWLMNRIHFIDFGPTGFGSGEIVIKKGMFLTDFQKKVIRNAVIEHMRFLRSCWRKACRDGMGEEPGGTNLSDEEYETQNLNPVFVELEGWEPKGTIARMIYNARTSQG